MRTVRWLVVAAGMVGSVAIGAVVDRTSHSVSDTLYGAAVPVLLLWMGVALVLVFLRPRRA
ncbi:MAG TPA: hypothetical protein VIA82_11370 [Candidatus Limnocylindria bacterium]|jgi:hypothetical protein